ncbi:monooxygenase [Fusarium beomiforme]|uniref:Monooxygenase n=1 Tax=Fusarium beomiforme TaxID=44412 RepID=A0A9P5AE21_9HYPO|nr:monooxygenase [Fusarium beomiforme]
MAENDYQETTGIIVCGCGPTGAMLSVLLSQYSIPHVILEKDPEVNADPRGIALDEDGIRYLQACGIYDKIFTEIGQCVENFRFIGKIHTDLSREPFLMMNYGTTEGGTGHPGFMCHKQPCIEQNLRSQIVALGAAKLRLGATVNSITEDGDWVYARYTDKSNQTRAIRGRFLVGADGKTGFTRKQYLEPKGVTMDQALDVPYEQDWVALNWKISLPTPSTHPDFPLWETGYTPQQVYDEFFPRDFRFLCNPVRASVCGRFGLNSDRLWRFEFVVLAGENPIEMAKEDQVAAIVHPYITHPGSRYGINAKSITYPLDCIQVLRCRPFRFSARSCNKWSLGRVVLCGDAAHVFPPFGGQGIASGFRDAISLAWRLRIAINGTSRPNELDYQKLLQGWYSERKQQLDKSLRSTVENGEYVTQSNTFKAFLRDCYFYLTQLVPSWKHWLQLGNRRDGMVRYQWQQGIGMAFLPKLGGGVNFPQVYATSTADTSPSEPIFFTDDIIFSRKKKGIFQLVVILQPDRSIERIETALSGLQKSSAGALQDGEATLFLDSTDAPPSTLKRPSIYRLATAEEFARDPRLCVGRPEPVGYDAHRMAKEVGNKTFVILRPDRITMTSAPSAPKFNAGASVLDTEANEPSGQTTTAEWQQKRGINPSDQIRTTRLVHMRYQHPDLETIRTFLHDFGMLTVKETEDRIWFRGYGVDQYVYYAQKGPKQFLGGTFEVETYDDLVKASKMERASPIQLLADAPGGGSLVTVYDPEGLPINFIHGQQPAEMGKMPDKLIVNFEDEKPRRRMFQRFGEGPAAVHKLGHYGLCVQDFNTQLDWYTRNFNFVPTDLLYVQDDSNNRREVALFAHIDRGNDCVDHHTIFLSTIQAGRKSHVHHCSFEVHDFDTQKLGHQWLAKKGYNSVWGVGRHILGSQIFDYWWDTTGNMVEHYADGDLVNKDTPVSYLPAGNESLAVWGPEVPDDFLD